jgi:cytochrome-b5 reductase
MKIGDRLDMRGPKGSLDYLGQGAFTINQLNMNTGKRNKETYQKRRFGFVAGGSGITPCLQVIRQMLKNPSDESEIWLLYANQTEKDILLRDELEAIEARHKQRFHLHFTLDTAPKRGWKGSEGFINTAMCKLALPAPERLGDSAATSDAFIFICGPPPMIKFAVEPALREIGFKDGEWMVF